MPPEPPPVAAAEAPPEAGPVEPVPATPGGGALSLVIRAEDGSVPEATVTIDPYYTGEQRALTAKESATIEGLAPEWNRVRVLAPGYAPVFLAVRLHLGGPVEATVALKRGATLAGAVRTEAGAPVPGAAVRSAAWGAVCSATTDATGAYRIEHLPAGRVEMEACVAGGRAWAFLVLEDGKESRWDPVLRPTEVISGRVVEEDGSPVARARVSCAWHGRSEVSAWDGIETDVDGAFRFEGCGGDMECVVSVWRPGAKGPVPAAEVAARPSDSPLTITLRRGEGYLSGTVLDRNGAPAAGAAIRVWPAARPDREVRAHAAEDGAFRLGPLPPGPYLVEFHLDGEPTFHLRPAVEVVAAEARDLGTIRFPAGGRIRASVLDTAGGVLPAEPVEVVSIDGSITFAGEPDEGAFLSEELTPGSYLVRAPAQGLLEEAAVVAGGLATVHLRVRPGASLTVIRVDASGDPVSDAPFRIEDPNGRIVRDDIYESDVFVAEGEYRVVAESRIARRRGETTVRVGREDVEVILVLE